MKHLPNVLTMINLLAGCLSIVMSFRGQPETAAYLIGAAAILDFLDGAAARLLRAYSDLGKQLDSLADLVSFGVAPAAILFHYMESAMGGAGNIPSMWPTTAFLLTVFAALRLAKFNTDPGQSEHFTGLPTPAAALLVASIPPTLAQGQGMVAFWLAGLTQSFPALAILVGLLSFLTVSPYGMFSLKIKSFAWKENRVRYVFLAGCLVLLAFFGWQALPLFLIFYILLSLSNHWLGSTK